MSDINMNIGNFIINKSIFILNKIGTIAKKFYDQIKNNG
jgi:hypothetical protein